MPGFDGAILEKMMERAAAAGVRFSDARAIRSASTVIEVQDGRVEKIHSSDFGGIGVRALAGNAWGFASCNGFDDSAALACLEQAIEMARALAPHAKEQVELAELPPLRETREPQGIKRNPREVPVSEKVAKLSTLEAAARAAGGKIANTSLTYWDGESEMIVANTRGTLVRGGAVRTRSALSVVAADENSRQVSRRIVGKQRGFELVEELTPEDYGAGAAREALALLEAETPPSGTMPVLFDPDIVGLLVHEAFGHNSEADLVRAGESIIAGKMGHKIGSDLVTIIDDATVQNGWGSYSFDAEGTPGARRVLVDRGIVAGYLHSLETAAHFGMAPLGSARCQDHQHAPIVRMSNTFFQPGASTFDEMVRLAGDGLYIKGALSGYVSTEKGQFTCRASEGRLIRNGKLDRLVRDVAVSGLTLEALANVIAVSNTFALEMPGTCGKSGQGAPVDAGGPHILVSGLVVGGAG